MKTQRNSDQPDRPTDSPPPPEPPDEDSDLDDLDEFDQAGTDVDDDRWDVFLPDDDERDPLPETGDFWTDRTRE